VLSVVGNRPLSRQEAELATEVLKLDPRAEKTRSALMRAFNTLVLSRGYDGLMPADVAAVAGVARSTLYEHFAGKEDMLRHSLLPILGPLSDCVCSTDVLPQLEHTLEHIRGSRRTARTLLSGRARIIAARTLARLIEGRLGQVPACRTAMPPTLLAAYLTNGILGLLEEWLAGRETSQIPVLARALQASTRAAAASMNGEASTA